MATRWMLFPIIALGAFELDAQAQLSVRASSDELRDAIHHELRLDLGVFSAIGYGGVTYTYSPVDAVRLEVGMGKGESGLQLSFMPKLALGNGRHAFILGVGPSIGIDASDKISSWLNLDVGYSFRVRYLSFYVAAGPTVGLAGRMHSVCIFESCTDDELRQGMSVKDVWGPQVRLGFGFAF